MRLCTRAGLTQVEGCELLKGLKGGQGKHAQVFIVHCELPEGQCKGHAD